MKDASEGQEGVKQASEGQGESTHVSPSLTHTHNHSEIHSHTLSLSHTHIYIHTHSLSHSHSRSHLSAFSLHPDYKVKDTFCSYKHQYQSPGRNCPELNRTLVIVMFRRAGFGAHRGLLNPEGFEACTPCSRMQGEPCLEAR